MSQRTFQAGTGGGRRDSPSTLQRHLRPPGGAWAGGPKPPSYITLGESVFWFFLGGWELGPHPAKGLLLGLRSGITPGKFRGPNGMLEIKRGLATCKANALSALDPTLGSLIKQRLEGLWETAAPFLFPKSCAPPWNSPFLFGHLPSDPGIQRRASTGLPPAPDPLHSSTPVPVPLRIP